MENLTLGGGHTVQYTDDVLWNGTLENYMISLNKCHPKNLILKITSK